MDGNSAYCPALMLLLIQGGGLGLGEGGIRGTLDGASGARVTPGSAGGHVRTEDRRETRRQNSGVQTL